MTLTRYYEALLVLPRRSQGWPHTQLCCPEERPPLSFFSTTPGSAGTRATSAGSLPTTRQLSPENQRCFARGRKESKGDRGNRQRCKTSAVLVSGSNLRTVGSRENLAPNPTHITRWRYPKDLIFTRIMTQWYRDVFFQYSKRSRWFLSLLQNTSRWGVSGNDKEALTALDKVLVTFLLKYRGCKRSSCLQVKTEGCWDATKD